MDLKFKDLFIEKWERYFTGTDLPIAWFYSDAPGEAEPVAQSNAPFQCVVCDLAKARKGRSICFSADAIGCAGGKRYFGFSQELRPGFEYFLLCGIPGQMEGERYKKSPEIVLEVMKHQPVFEAPGKYIIFKRWDMLGAEDDPMAVVFFATPDVLSGLFTLANFDEAGREAVVAPFSAGCGSIVGYPYHELQQDKPRAVLGMFDVSARPCMLPQLLSFAIPWPKFESMVGNMDESFLITKSWGKVRERIAKS